MSPGSWAFPLITLKFLSSVKFAKLVPKNTPASNRIQLIVNPIINFLMFYTINEEKKLITIVRVLYQKMAISNSLE